MTDISDIALNWKEYRNNREDFYETLALTIRRYIKKNSITNKDFAACNHEKLNCSIVQASSYLTNMKYRPSTLLSYPAGEEQSPNGTIRLKKDLEKLSILLQGIYVPATDQMIVLIETVYGKDFSYSAPKPRLKKTA